MSQNPIFDLNPVNFQLALAEQIPLGEENAKPQAHFHGLFISSELTDEKTRNRNQRRISENLEKMTEDPAGPQVSLATQDGQRRTYGYYWESAIKKSQYVGKLGYMPLSMAMAMNLVKQHFAELLTGPQKADMEYLFERAETNLAQHRLTHPATQALSYRPLSTDWVKVPDQDSSNFQVLIDAINNKQVIKADYESIQANLPDQIVFSPQQIRMQFMRVYVVGYVHNSKPTAGIPEPGIYRHLDITRFKNIESGIGGVTYQNIPQPEESFKFVAYIHPWVRNAMKRLKCSEDQELIEFSELGDEEKQKIRECIPHMKTERPWHKVTATIKLTFKFLDQHDDWDAWFFVNALSIYGADIIVTEPSQVVNEIRRRVNDNSKAYASLEHNRHIQPLPKTSN